MTRIKNVRNTTKFKRSIKAISPVIATLLMIAIAVVASLVVYAWVTGYMGNATSKAGKAIAIPSFAVDDSGNMVIYVQNVGQGDLEVSSVYINGDLRFSTNTPIGEGETEELSVTTGAPYDPTERYDIKVTTTDGTFMTATGKPGTGDSTTPATTYAVNFVLGTGGLSMNPVGAQTVGGIIAITATENSGYHFTSWSSSTGSITFGDDSLASTSATINGAGTITANFAADTVQYSVTFVLGTNGATISPTAGAHSYDAGSSVPITVTASSGYHFTSWSSSTGSITFGDDSLASTSATINGAGTITANFAADTVQYSVTFALGSNGATITPTAGAHTYNSGDVIAISASASSGYHFTSWTSTTTSIIFGNANSASTTATIGAAGTVTANFAANTAVTITLRPNAVGSTEDLDEDYGSLANWQCVNENPDSTSTYVYTANNNYRTDSYDVADQSLSGAITHVDVYVSARKESSGDSVYARTAIRLNSGTIAYGSANSLSSSNWNTYHTDYTTKPSELGNGAWTWQNINDLEIGVSLQTSDWRNDARCTSVWVVITYIPA